MKILYVADDRGAAGLAARALQGTAPVALSWAKTLGSALEWVQANRDATALIVEDEVQGEGYASFLQQVRGLGLPTPVVVVMASAHREEALAALRAGADGCVVAGPSMLSELPRVLARAVERGSRSVPARGPAGGAAAPPQPDLRLEGAEQARRRSESELATAAAQLADLQARHSAALAREARISTALQQRLLELEAAVRTADERQAAEAGAFADQLAKRHAEFTASLAQAAQSRDALAAQLTVATAALDEAQQARRRDAAAAAEELRQREAQLGAQLHEAAAARTAIEESVSQAEAALRETRERTQADLAAANERQAALDDLLAQEADRCKVLDRKVAAAEAALREADQRHAKDLEDATARLADLQARHEAARAEHEAARSAFEQQLADAASSIERAARERESEAVAAAEHFRQREAELGARLAEAAARTTGLESGLAQAEAALRENAQRADVDRAAADARRAELEQLLAAESDRRTSVAGTLASVEASLEEANQRHAADLATASRNLAALQERFEGAVAEHATARAGLEQRVSEADAQRLQAEERATAALAAAAARETDLAERLTGESAVRSQLEAGLAELGAKAAHRRRRSLRVAAAWRRRSLGQKERLEAQLAGERAGAERRIRSKDDEILEVRQERDRSRHLLGTTQEQLRRLHASVDEERQAYARARETSESELQRVSGEYGQLRRSFDQLQAAFQALERVAGEHAAERARLETVVSERDGQLSALAERHRAADQIAQDSLAHLKERLRHVLETGGAEVARLQKEIVELRRELDASRTHAQALRGVAERVPDLQARLELTEKERRREFERAPYGLCRCTADGVITDANHSFVRLLGRRRADQVRNMDFAAAVADSTGDVSWLIERARVTGKAQTADTSWKARHGVPLFVRLQVLPAATGSLDVVVEDITRLRLFEAQLRRSERMEAVGRLASETAGTCERLLGDVVRAAREWLAGGAGDDVQRRRGEMVLADLARAEAYLRQLGAYSDAQARGLEPVSVQRIVRRLAPVLKRIAGDDVEVVLPRTSGPFDVDVEAERVERVLVNIAGCVRERMPHGGQLSVDLATETIGRRFLSRHPGVRPGPHVLVTVTGLPRTSEPHAGAERDAALAGRPAVDLTGLGDLVAACGGHLWMDAPPAGPLVVKIHLPKPLAVETADAGGSGVLPQGARRLTRWFRTTSGSGVKS